MVGTWLGRGGREGRGGVAKRGGRGGEVERVEKIGRKTRTLCLASSDVKPSDGCSRGGKTSTAYSPCGDKTTRKSARERPKRSSGD